VLCVDSDERTLAGLELRLRRSFDVVTATSAALALSKLDLSAPFAVVLSDMHMPQVSGSALLSAIRRVTPETVRILMTGQADLASAMAAVNEGEVFRILFKHVEASELIAACEAAVVRHRELIAERQVTEGILHGTIDLLTMSLAALSPTLSLHASRIHALVTDMAAVVCTRQLWVAELASVLLEVSLANVPTTLVERWRARASLTEDERVRIATAIRSSLAVVRHIPRAEPVTEGLLSLATMTEFDHNHPVSLSGSVPIRVLHLALVFDALERSGKNADEALQEIRAAAHADDVPLVAALASSPSRLNPGSSRGPLWRIRPGQTVLYDVRRADGVLVLPKGHVVDATTLGMLDLMDEGTRLLEVITVGSGPATAP